MSFSQRPARTALYRRREGGFTTIFGLLVLAAVLLLGWAAFSLTRSTTASASSPAAVPLHTDLHPAAITYREPSSGAAPIPQSLAVQHARLFSGLDHLPLDGALQQGRYGAGAYATYLLETPDGEQTYRVDARSGEVLEMTRLDAIGYGPIRLDQPAAEDFARRYAAERFHGFADLVLVDSSLTPAAANTHLYAFKWSLLDAGSGAEVPTSVSVSVSSASGEVVWYLAQRQPVAVDTKPAISREDATATAALLADRADRWDARSPTGVRLQVVYDQHNAQRLAWSITFPGKSDPTPEGRPSLRILVDAHTGEPISNPI
jgi:hypothetical protein